MNRKKQSKQQKKKLEAELDALEACSHAELKARWNELLEAPCPPHMGRKFLLRAVAYRLQENALGGLSAATLRKLKRAEDRLAAGRSLNPPGPVAKPGTRLLREWHGQTHEVIVLESSVQYRGKSYPSLSAVAREITGSRWSGPRFFGLKGAPDGKP